MKNSRDCFALKSEFSDIGNQNAFADRIRQNEFFLVIEFFLKSKKLKLKGKT